jgi:sigma-B regulation protein RsbU (phosphoserine phosphatase)
VLKRARRCGERCISSALAVSCLVVFVSMASAGMGQVVDATQWHSGTVTLNEGWRERDGDNLAWAQPGYDDSGWQPVELDDLGAAQPGWRWYRLHLKLAKERPHEHLLLVGGEGVYELYVNGRRDPDTSLRSMFSVKRPTEQVVVLSDDVDDFTLALRTRATQSYMIWKLPLFLTAAVGSAGAIDDMRVSFESQRLYPAIPSLAINGLLLLAGLAVFALYVSQSKRAEYLWLGLYLFLLGLSNGLLYSSITGLLPLAWNNDLGDPLLYVYTIMQIEFTFRFAGRRVSRTWRVYEALLASSIALSVVSTSGALASDIYVSVQALIILPAALLLPVMLLVWYRKGNREAGWLIAPSLLPAASVAIYDAGNMSIFSGWGKLDFLANPIPLGLVSLQLSDIGDLLFLLAIAVVMFFRFTRVSREQARGAAELEAAREIQRRLVPAKLPQTNGYVIEAAYFPAQEVGGDFYQVFAQGDNAQLVVVGDVSGKGLKAAMTGTLALGALRALAAEGLGPAAVLTRLNRQQVETQDGGFITCICARVTERGEVTMANAGHLSPYRNGEELLVSSDLPLGISQEEVYEERTFQLEAGDQLTLLSDGVLEARDAHGALFGFERMRAISAQTAESIAAAALKFGQEDDITVLTLARLGAGSTERIQAVAIPG